MDYRDPAAHLRTLFIELRIKKKVLVRQEKIRKILEDDYQEHKNQEFQELW